MRKALFFDIDGTLVNFLGKMPKSTELALRLAKEKGHQIVICSGRTKYQIYPWLLKLGFHGIIGATGAYVECGGKVIYEHYMQGETLQLALRTLESVHASYSAQTKTNMIATKESRARIIQGYCDAGYNDEEVLKQEWGNAEQDEQIALRMDIEKLIYQDADCSASELQRKLKDVCDVTASSFGKSKDGSGEITCIGINKAFGIQRYMEFFEILKEDTIAFGDGPNDFDMIEYANIGVVMGNAGVELKKAADFVTTDIDENGIAYALRELGLI